MKLKLYILAVLILTAFSSNIQISAQTEGQLKAEIDEAIRLYPKEKLSAYNRLSNLGDPAFPFLVEIISDDNYATYGRAFKKSRLNPFLLSVIEDSTENRGEESLIHLLKSSDNIVKGMVLQALGRKKSKIAIPCITPSLEDTSVFMYNRTTDHGPMAVVVDEPITIREIAVKTLEEITDFVLKPSKDISTQAKAWLRWSKARNFPNECSVTTKAKEFDNLSKMSRF